MHMILRTLFIFLRKKFFPRKPIDFGDKAIVQMRVLPTDLDLLWHVNNGVYFSFMDFGRWDMIFRNGVYDASVKKGWYSVVTGETIKFKKSLKLWDKFELETQIMGHDEKHFFIHQRFLRSGEVMATGLVKVRFLRRGGGTVETSEVLGHLGGFDLSNDAEELSREWRGLEGRYLT